MKLKTCLSIAGSDPSGGAGVQADIKTFGAHGVYGMCVITALTVQNTKKVIDSFDVPKEYVGAQIDAIFDDITVDAVKIGMIANIDTIEVIAEKMDFYKPQHIVLDPVMVSKSGYPLMPENTVSYLIEKLLPKATLITPNIPEAQAITGIEIKNISDMKRACYEIEKMNVKNILIKGGHLEDKATDLFYDGEITLFEEEKINTKNTHGTGCTLSSSIASNLAKGLSPRKAVENSKKYITEAIKNSLDIGHGCGPTNHFYFLGGEYAD